jgi:PPOX class probable F420-dependent enzyme
MSVQFHDMSQQQIEEFVSSPRHGVFATNRSNGPPQLTPVWYLYQDKKIYVSMFTGSAKYKNLCRDPRASICIAGESPDARAVIFSGKVELFLGDDEDWVNDVELKLTRRYFDSDEAMQSYLDSIDNSSAYAIAMLSPDKIIAQDYN